MKAGKDHAILEAFRDAIDRFGLAKPGETVLIAFSGGPDSTALLSLFLAARRELRIKLALAHFNHRLRPDAKEDEAFARATAKRFRLPLVAGSKDVKAYARRHKMNLEEAGRELRYKFLRRAAQKLGAERIATGHTADDQAETVLMRILRGTGLRGLGGIRPRGADGLIRPLLGIERKEIARWLAARRLDFRTDETNRDLRFLRNRIRHEVLPLLMRVEPKVVAHLVRLALILQDEEDARVGAGTDRAPGRAALDARALARLPKALARREVRGFLEKVRGNLRGVTFADVESILSLADGKKRTLSKGLVVGMERGLISVADRVPAKTGFSYIWDGRGALTIKETGFRLRGRVEAFDGTFPAPFDDRVRAFLDADKMTFPLLVRNRFEGDRYRPLGAPGSKKLKEILRAKGVPVRERDRIPVIFAGAPAAGRVTPDALRVAWVPGLPVAEAFKVGPGTRRILWIERKG